VNYDQALQEINNGNHVTREIWDIKTYVMKINTVLKQKVTYNTIIDYSPTNEDTNATDWKVWG
jgi:hypothetical protein